MTSHFVYVSPFFGDSILPAQSSPGSQVLQLSVTLLFEMAEPEPEDSQEVQGSGVDIYGLANEWENSRVIRNQLLESGSVAFNLPGKYHPTHSVSGVGANLHTLMPLMPKLWVGSGHDYGQIGMVSIPSLEHEFLGNTTVLEKQYQSNNNNNNNIQQVYIWEVHHVSADWSW